MDLTFLRLPPSPDLAEQVENFWIMRGGGSAAMPDGHRILPDGSMEFVFQLGEPFRERRADGTWRLQNHYLLVGQMERCVDIKPTGAFHTVGIHFRPAGVAAFVAGDLSRFANRIVPLASVLDVDLAELVGRLGPSPKPPKTVGLLEPFLRDLRLQGDPAMSAAAARLSAGLGVLDLDSLARQFELSGRQFRRRFESAVGIGPKRFSRLVRFQRVFDQRRERDATAWSEVALDCGYYDQAHFNRDFRAFTGVKPRDIVRDADPLTAFFLSVSSKTALSKSG